MWMSKEANDALENAKQTDDYWIARAQLDFAKELNKIRNKTNVNGKTLAQRLGTSAAYISRVLRGDTNLTIESMVKLARATGAKVEIKLTHDAVAAGPVVTNTEGCKVVPIPSELMKRLTKQLESKHQAVHGEWADYSGRPATQLENPLITGGLWQPLTSHQPKIAKQA
jgi:transcriptional regulator with XRE-family HTH domain